MSWAVATGLTGMTQTQDQTTTLTQLAVTMFSVSDQDAARAFYTEVLGFEVRGDERFGADGADRWLEVAPPGSSARLALNPPMGGSPGGGSVGVESTDVLAEHRRLAARGDVDLDPAPTQVPGAPLLFAVRDPDGNTIWVVEEPAS